jgi:hypothetical protein
MGICARRERLIYTTTSPRIGPTAKMWEAEEQDVLGSFWLWHSYTSYTYGGGSYGSKRGDNCSSVLGRFRQVFDSNSRIWEYLYIGHHTNS